MCIYIYIYIYMYTCICIYIYIYIYYIITLKASSKAAAVVAAGPPRSKPELNCIILYYTISYYTILHLINYYTKWLVSRAERSNGTSRFIKGGCSGNRVKWFIWCYVLVYDIILPPSTARPSHCTSLWWIPRSLLSSRAPRTAPSRRRAAM